MKFPTGSCERTCCALLFGPVAARAGSASTNQSAQIVRGVRVSPLQPQPHFDSYAPQ